MTLTRPRMPRLLSILFWSVIAAAFIGPGTVTTAASAGAAHGHALLWALAFSTLATVVLQEAAARVTVVSGHDLGEAIRRQFGGSARGVLVMALVLGAIVAGNAAYEAGNILGAAAGAELGSGMSRRTLTALIGAVAATVLWVGTPRTVAKILGITVAVMGVAFLVAAAQLRPDLPSLVASALIPSFPPASGMLILGLIGTTVVPYNLFLGSGIAAGHDLRELRFGIGVAVVLGGLISMGILVVGAAVVGEFSYPAVAGALESRLGPGAGSLFAWGLFAAGLSSAITAPLAAAITARSLLAGDSRSWDPGSVRYRAVWGGVLLFGIGFGLAEVRPIPAIILAQALNGVVLPFAAIFLFGVVNDRTLMGDEGMNGRFANAALGLVVLITVVLGAAGVMRAGAAALGLPAPGELTLLSAAAVAAALLAVPVARRIRSLRRAPARRGPGGVAAVGLVMGSLALAGGCASARPGPPPMEAQMAPGVSLELARHRAAVLSDVEYHLTLDLTGEESIPGSVLVAVSRGEAAGDLVLDYRGAALHEVSANGEPVEDHSWENGHILIPERYLLPGENVIHLGFTSLMAAAGASVIRTEEDAAVSVTDLDTDVAPDPDAQPEAPTARDVYLYSLLVPADANQLFPSFDQPDLKAVFVFEAVAPTGWRVMTNGVLDERGQAGGGEEWRFLPTEPISTYLFAFAAGPWQTVTERDPPAGRDPMTLYLRASRAAEADADTIIALNRDALGWLERYFAMEYPFSKYDMLLAPAFPFGGMEHPGAVFYNESRFVFREPPTLVDRLGRASTIYHEVAHQWFGDLVTMRWFDDLWLKEGFSTYMAARMQEELNPGTGAWKTFYMRNKPLAYAVDATSGTTPVWQELENLDLAKSNYGPIVYNKAPSILKQLEHLVGDAAFREGLRLLLREHAYANITWRDLLDALEAASGESLDAFGEHYILRPGMPIVETVLELDGGAIGRLALAQRPARALPGDPGGWWPGRINVRLGYEGREDVVLPVAFSGDTTVVDAAAGLPAPDYVFANDGDYGYGIFLLDERSAAALAGRVGEIEDELLRAMVWGALWDLVGEMRLPPESFVELVLRELPVEPDEQTASSILGRAGFSLRRHLPRGDAAGDSLQRRYETLLIARMSDGGLDYGQRKASLDALLSGARSPEALEVLLELLREDRHFDGAPLRQPSRWAAVQTLIALGHPAADSLRTAERARDASAEAARRDFVAGAAVPDPTVKAEYFRRYFEDAGLNEEWVTASLGEFNHPEHEALSLRFLRPALERLPWIRDNRRIFFLPQWVNSFIGGHSTREALEIVDAYLADNPDLPLDLRRKVLQARDGLEVVVRTREGRG